MSVTQTDEPPSTPSTPPPACWPATFSTICDAHRGRLVRWLAAMFGPHDAEDIAQEALARLYARPGQVDASDPWPWLSVVARNVGRDMARHNAYARPVDAHDLADLPSPTRVLDEVAARDEADRLARAMQRLSARDRALIRLRDVEGYSVRQIAREVGGSENAVRQQLFRARRRLQQAYVALGGDRVAGIVALSGLRLREFMRRHSPVIDAITSVSATVLAVVAGSVGVLTGGAPAAASSAAPVPVANVVRYVPTTSSRTAPEWDVPHGVATAGIRITVGATGNASDPKRLTIDADSNSPLMVHFSIRPDGNDGYEEDSVEARVPIVGTTGEQGGGWFPAYGRVCRAAASCD